MNYFISYDITDNKFRTKVSKVLERQGCTRVQKSVFFAPAFTSGEIQILKQKLENIVSLNSKPTDSILCIPIEKNYISQLIWIGENEALKESQQKVWQKVV